MTSQLENDLQTPLLEAGNHGLFEGVKRGILEQVQEALRNGAEIDGKETERGETALHLAARYAHVSVIEFLLAEGADFYVRDNDERTPLMSACYGRVPPEPQALQVVEVLLRHSRTRAMVTEDPSQDATLKGSSNMGESTTDQAPPQVRSYVNILGKDGSTALTIACWRSTAEIVHLLLGSQANVNAQEVEGDTPLILAARYGDAKMVEYVLEVNPDIHKVRNTGRSALHQAMRRETNDDRERIVELLLKKGLSASLKDAEGSTPLHLASNHGYANIVKKLLDHPGLDVNAQNNSKETSLHLASESGYLDVVGQLLDHSAIKVNLQSSSNATPLFRAVEENHPRIVQKLLNHVEIDPNVRSLVGMTPLHAACAQGYLEMVEALLDCLGIDVNIMDFVRRSPLIRAIERNRPEIVERLLNHIEIDLGRRGSLERTPLHRASMRGNLKIVELITDKTKEQINSQDEKGLTALHLACQNGHMGVVRRLLSLGAKTRVSRNSAQSAWYCFVGYLFESWNKTEPEAHRSAPTSDDINLILVSADAEEKESATEWADNNDKRTFLARVMRISEMELKYHEVIRLAKSSDQSDTAENIVDLLKRDTRFDPKPTSALQWATFHGYHDVVWWLLKNSTSIYSSEFEAKDDRDAAAIIARGRHYQLTQQQEKHVGKLTRNEGNTKKKKETNDNFRLTLKMLTDTHVAEDARPESWLDYDTSQQGVLGAHSATIVDFYQRDRKVELLRRSDSVFNVIYGEARPDDEAKGPEGIMNKARTSPKDNKDEAAKEKEHEKKDLLMRWIHLPANNMEWMEDLAKRIFIDKKTSWDEWRSLNDFLQRSWHELPTDTAPGRFMKPVCLKELTQWPTRNTVKEELKESEQVDVEKDRRASAAEIQDHGGHQTSKPKRKADDGRAEGHAPQSSSSSDPIAGSSIAPKPGTYERVALYMPYLTFGLCHRKPLPIVVENTDGPPDKDIIALKKELKAVEKYEDLLETYKKQTIHGSRSLDQFFYNSLLDMDMNDRDQNQVFTRSFFGTLNGDGVPEGKNNWPYLAVGQFWLWVIDEGTIITSSTHRRDSFNDPVGEGLFHQLRQASIKKNGQSLPTSVQDLARLMVTFCVDFLHTLKWGDFASLQQRNTNPPADDKVSSMPVQLLYEDRINFTATSEKKLFSDFKNKMKDMKVNSQKSLARKKPETRNANDRTSGIKTGSKTNYKSAGRNWASISSAAELLDEVKDILDELTILKTLVTRQVDVWKDLVGNDSVSKSARGPVYTLRGVQEMIDMADRVQESVNDILSLEQNGINIDQASESARQGMILMAFTIVTVVFTPLSFLTSLFALNVTSFQHNSSGDIEFEPGWIFPILFCCSAAIIALLMIFAFKGQEVLGNSSKKWGQSGSQDQNAPQEDQNAPQEHQTQRTVCTSWLRRRHERNPSVV